MSTEITPPRADTIDRWRQEASKSSDPHRSVAAQAAYSASVKQAILVTLRDSMALVTDQMAEINALMKTINEALGKAGGQGPDASITVATGAMAVQAVKDALVAGGIDTGLYKIEGSGANVKLVMTKEAATKINGNLDIEVQALSSRHQKLSATVQQALQGYNVDFDIQTTAVKDAGELATTAIGGIKALASS